MKNKLWEIISGKKSIRIQILWAICLSFICTFFILAIVELVAPDLTMLTFIVVFVGLFVIFTRHIVKYLSTLTDGLRTISEGNLNYRLPITRQDELGKVAEHMNYLAEQLQKQLERERMLEKSKMELITYVSHDLRTPLTSIIGYLDLLKTHQFDDVKEQERYIDNAYNKTQQLKKLIDDLFEYTRLTNQDVRLTYQIVNLHSLLQQMISEIEPVAKEQGITFEIETNSTSTMVPLDVEKIVRAIDNLLVNALKYSFKPGSVKVKMLGLPDQIILSVENYGRPITQEQAQQLFERFYQLEESPKNQKMPYGYGLGLSITKQIIELHQGRVGLLHSEGHYKFYIELPLHS
ncbi:HAMP domain-containing sensor histidine kinase [Paenibacillus albiflavus]|uniref:HAMP domain-containing sensor histidine kinase n=1 Tax=Paenibacillus albiflavus TaxID=2545760 RepID=UPI001F1E730A|nr:HAMP domain-containing sensor histidine kinase [Paenibacillus albiflavus]